MRIKNYKLKANLKGFLNEMKNSSGKTGQAIAEYFLILCLVLSAIIATGFVGKARGALQIYFTNAVNTISIDK